MKLQAQEGNKITDKNRTFFNDFIYVPDNYNPDDYEEVPYEIWCNFLPELVPKNKVDELQNQIIDLQNANDELGELLLETDYRLLQIQIYGLEEI